MVALAGPAKNSAHNDRVFKLERRLLEMMTVSQRSRLWSNLDTLAQKSLMVHVMGDDDMAVEFWNTLNHDTRCLMINQLEESDVPKLFRAMKDLENRTSLMMMLK